MFGFTVCLSVLVLFVTVDSIPFGLEKPVENSSNMVNSSQKTIVGQDQLDSLMHWYNHNSPDKEMKTAQDFTKVKVASGDLDFDKPQEQKRSKRGMVEKYQTDINTKVTMETRIEEFSATKEPPTKVSMEEITGIEKPSTTEQSSTKDLDLKEYKYKGNVETAEHIAVEVDSGKTQILDTEKIARNPEHNTTLRDLPPSQDYVFYATANGSFKLHRPPAVWTDARLICYDEGAELASPENEALSVAMSAVLLTTRQPPLLIFTGVNDLYSKGFFTSLRGIPLSAMPVQWAPREPDNVNHGTNCLVMQRNGLLLDSKCDDFYSFICYKRQQTSLSNLCDTTDTGYIYNRHTNTCHKIHAEDASWQDAYATCVREGGYLAVISSDYEAKVLSGLTKRWAHIGISYWRKDLWMTIHGQTLSEAGFETWASGEPNDVNEERCGCLSDYGFLVDVDCEDHPLPFVCEKSV